MKTSSDEPGDDDQIQSCGGQRSFRDRPRRAVDLEQVVESRTGS